MLADKVLHRGYVSGKLAQAGRDHSARTGIEGPGDDASRSREMLTSPHRGERAGYDNEYNNS